jgi:hypothetical protein
MSNLITEKIGNPYYADLMNIIDNLQLKVNELGESNKVARNIIDRMEKSINIMMKPPPPRHTYTTCSTGLARWGLLHMIYPKNSKSKTIVEPRLQQIDPETMQLVMVHESFHACNAMDNRIKKKNLTKAIKGNGIYRGFRWLFVARELDPMVISELSDTQNITCPSQGYVVKLDVDKKTITDVYFNRETACSDNGYESKSHLDYSINYSKVREEGCYMMYTKCNEELKDAFIEKNGGVPLLYMNGIGKYDRNANLIQEYLCKRECMKLCSMTSRKFIEVTGNNIMHEGYYYEYMKRKLRAFEIATISPQ